MRPHSSNSVENATPSSGTPPLASYKEVPPSRGIGATENASKSPHLCVTVNKSSIRYGFHAGANPVRYGQGVPKPMSDCPGQVEI